MFIYFSFPYDEVSWYKYVEQLFCFNRVWNFFLYFCYVCSVYLNFCLWWCLNGDILHFFACILYVTTCCALYLYPSLFLSLFLWVYGQWGLPSSYVFNESHFDWLIWEVTKKFAMEMQKFSIFRQMSSQIIAILSLLLRWFLNSSLDSP